MFELDISPILLKLGPLSIRYYGFVFVLGFIIGLIALFKAIKKGKLEITKEKAYDFIFYLLIGILVGARIFHVLLWGWDYYFSNPIKIFYIWEGGVSFHGGLTGAIIVAYVFSKKNKINFWRIADILTLPAIFALALGRLANFLNQEILGTITELPFCVKFLRADPLNCRHPVQLYAAVGRFSAFFFLLKFDKNHKDGYIFWNFVFLLGFGRIVLDFLREDIRYAGLSIGQWLSILMMLFSGYVLFRKHREDLGVTFGFKKKAANNQNNPNN